MYALISGGRRGSRALPATVFALLAPFAGACADAQTEPARVLIEYRDKPPYSYTVNGQPGGLLIDKTTAIFRRAGVAYQFSEVPLKRIAQDLQTAAQPICSPGWYKLPERERVAQFSLPFHQDRPQTVLASAEALAAVRGHRNFRSLLQDERLQLGVVDGVSYGGEIDRLIAARPRPPLHATVTAFQLARMLGAGRADFMLIDVADLRWLDRNGEIRAKGVQRVDFTDMPAGLHRHLMCSKSLDAATLYRLNVAIRQLGLDSSGPLGPDG
ncbi:MAG: transporter substrate-binding domain-containing protein [Burkholderiaceae bacterium]